MAKKKVDAWWYRLYTTKIQGFRGNILHGYHGYEGGIEGYKRWEVGVSGNGQNFQPEDRKDDRSHRL